MKDNLKFVLSNSLISGKVLSVSQFLDILNNSLSEIGGLVEGEISGLQVRPYSVFFSLKDQEDQSLLNCYMPRRLFDSMGFSVEDGLSIRAFGIAGIYKPSGRLSFQVNGFGLIGEGTLKKSYEILKAKLDREGLFIRKRPIPDFPLKIGVITSRDGVVIHDFLTNLGHYGFQIDFHDARVEGVDAVASLVKALANVAKTCPDIIVIMRGGGSLESMQAFNNELVVKAIFNSPVPVICGIGHEVDVPLACLVSDAYVSTPTAVAHHISRNYDGARRASESNKDILLAKFELLIRKVNDQLARGREKMLDGLIYKLRIIKERIAFGAQYLRASSPLRYLEMGYSLARDQRGNILKSINQVSGGEEIITTLLDGIVKSNVKSKEKNYN